MDKLSQLSRLKPSWNSLSLSHIKEVSMALSFPRHNFRRVKLQLAEKKTFRKMFNTSLISQQYYATWNTEPSLSARCTHAYFQSIGGRLTGCTESYLLLPVTFSRQLECLSVDSILPYFYHKLVISFLFFRQIIYF